tara:strand:+ start:1028 stop:1303 length:276 start_codon:yes stop_codon:yes gene_type:complete
MSMIEHDEYLENKFEQYQEEIGVEYEKHFSDNEIYIIKQIRLGQLAMDIMREQLIDFFNENPLPDDKIHEYTICSDEEILDRLDIDLGGVI